MSTWPHGARREVRVVRVGLARARRNPIHDPRRGCDAIGYGFDAGAVALRELSTSVCIDDDCELSFGQAHAGPCEPCSCGLEHAVWECPVGELRFRLEAARAESEHQPDAPPAGG